MKFLPFFFTAVLFDCIMLSKSSDNEKQPWFCNNKACPAYDVVKSTEFYEERCYNKSTWAYAGYTYQRTPLEGIRTMLHILYKYINGENKKKMTLAMTTPFLTQFIPVNRKAKMHFFMNTNDMTKVPEPSTDQVFLWTYPKTCYYVHRFALGERKKKKTNIFASVSVLKNHLHNAGILINEDTEFYMATYDKQKSPEGKAVQPMDIMVKKE